MTNQLAQALETIAPTTTDVLGDSVTFSPIRWKTGWPHHLRRVPPFRDDARASITRGEVFEFAADVHASEFNRDQVIDFLGAAFAFAAGQSNQVMQQQAFLRNKGNAAKLLTAIRGLQDEADPAEAYAALVATGLAPKYASTLVYFLGGPQDAAPDEAPDAAGIAPAIICSKRARIAGLESDADWTEDEYRDYLERLRQARDAYDTSLGVDAVEYAARKFADR